MSIYNDAEAFDASTLPTIFMPYIYLSLLFPASLLYCPNHLAIELVSLQLVVFLPKFSCIHEVADPGAFGCQQDGIFWRPFIWLVCTILSQILTSLRINHVRKWFVNQKTTRNFAIIVVFLFDLGIIFFLLFCPNSFLHFIKEPHVESFLAIYGFGYNFFVKYAVFPPAILCLQIVISKEFIFQ